MLDPLKIVNDIKENVRDTATRSFKYVKSKLVHPNGHIHLLRTGLAAFAVFLMAAFVIILLFNSRGRFREKSKPSVHVHGQECIHDEEHKPVEGPKTLEISESKPKQDKGPVSWCDQLCGICSEYSLTCKKACWKCLKNVISPFNQEKYSKLTALKKQKLIAMRSMQEEIKTDSRMNANDKINTEKQIVMINQQIVDLEKQILALEKDKPTACEQTCYTISRVILFCHLIITALEICCPCCILSLFLMVVKQTPDLTLMEKIGFFTCCSCCRAGHMEDLDGMSVTGTTPNAPDIHFNPQYGSAFCLDVHVIAPLLSRFTTADTSLAGGPSSFNAYGVAQEVLGTTDTDLNGCSNCLIKALQVFSISRAKPLLQTNVVDNKAPAHNHVALNFAYLRRPLLFEQLFLVLRILTSFVEEVFTFLENTVLTVGYTLYYCLIYMVC